MKGFSTENMTEPDYFDWIFGRLGFATGSDCWKMLRFSNGSVWRRKIGAFWWRDANPSGD